MRMPKTRTRQGSRVKRRALGRPARLWRRSRRAYANMNMCTYTSVPIESGKKPMYSYSQLYLALTRAPYSLHTPTVQLGCRPSLE